MSVRFATPDEIDKWDDLITGNPDGGNVFALYEVAEVKWLNGWRPRYLVAGEVYITILEKSVWGLGRFWYAPKGPGVASVAQIAAMLDDLRTFGRGQGVFAIKIEPEIAETDGARVELSSLGLVRTAPVQPNSSTVLVDLAPEEADILASFNQKGRHALHRAERDGVVVRRVDVSDENVDLMYQLLADTAEGRFDASLRSHDYYRHFWQGLAASGHGALFFAYDGSRVVASAYVMKIGRKGLYKDGASVRDHPVYGASHLLQWEIMKYMKSEGVTSYDLCGAPHSSQIHDESNHLYGIGRFKTSFNKHVTDYVGCYDIVVRKTAYRVWWRVGQRLAVSLSWRLNRQQWF